MTKMKTGDLVATHGTFMWGDLVLILSQKGDTNGTRWLVLRTDGTTGWISSYFLRPLL